jgi:hypothetical protein
LPAVANPNIEEFNFSSGEIMTHQMLLPMVVYVGYIWLINVVNFLVRFNAIRKGIVKRHYFKTFLGDPPPEKIIRLGRHLDNQYQQPILFLIASTLLITLNLVDSTSVALAWGYVISRFFHAFVHLGNNHVLARASVFAVAWFFVALLWIELLLRA